MYQITSSLLGYTNTSTSFVIDGPNQVRNIILNMPIDPVSRKGTINGVIKDKNDLSIANAYVILFEVIKDPEEKETLNPIRYLDEFPRLISKQIPEGYKKNKTDQQ